MQFKTLGDRMNYYRGLADYKLPAKAYVLAMLDGRSFSKNFRDKLNKPFDEGFIEDMNETAKYLCENISGCKFAFVQSDEISLFIADYENPKTQSWFDYRLNKMLPLSASMASNTFNRRRLLRSIARKNFHVDVVDLIQDFKPAEFDAKFWTVPSQNDVFAWFMYRQNDCVRNSISMAAQAYFSHNQLHGKNTDDMQEMLFREQSINWNNYPIGQKRGRLVIRKEVQITDSTKTQTPCDELVIRNKWVIEDAPPLNTQEGKDFLLSLIPINEPNISFENSPLELGVM